MNGTVYALVASDRPFEIRYIGKTTRVFFRRLEEHWCLANRQNNQFEHKKSAWMREVKSRGASVRIVKLYQTDSLRDLGEVEAASIRSRWGNGLLTNLAAPARRY